MTRWTLAAVLAIVASASLSGIAEPASHVSSGCARGYSPCLPVAGDLDCDQIPDSKKPVRVTGVDPYGLDRDHDGLGCEIAGEGGGARSRFGLIVRKPPRKEATVVRLGDTVTLVGWSPASMRGRQFHVSHGVRIGFTIAEGTLKGTVQVFGTAKVTRDSYSDSVFFVRLWVKGIDRAVADDGARLAR